MSRQIAIGFQNRIWLNLFLNLATFRPPDISRIISRSGRGVEPYEAGFRDVASLGENETAEAIARFHPWREQYMFHCRDLVHEDGDVMAAFDVGDNGDAL
ncbi:hypothetical protein EV426DRAFT_716771 [Tirmania nivea]|nr:hypothetical protein EV426DRAFT_716771 [Tirmania nivea]